MTDRIKGFYVVLEGELRDDDADELRQAIQHLSGVQHCSPLVAQGMYSIEREAARRDLVQMLIRELTGKP